MDSESSCELSPQARAFSTVLTAFVGSIVNGVTSGGIVAFVTGWISWLAVLRVLTGALIGLYKAFSPTTPGWSKPRHRNLLMGLRWKSEV